MKTLLHAIGLLLIFPVAIIGQANNRGESKQENLKNNHVLLKDTVCLPVCNLEVDTLTSLATWNINCDSANPYFSEIIGYHALLDGNFEGMTTDTTFDYRYLNFNQEYTAGIAVEYTFGFSDTVYHSFISGYLPPPLNLEGIGQDDYAYLTWDPPRNLIANDRMFQKNTYYGFDNENRKFFQMPFLGGSMDYRDSCDRNLICGDFSHLSYYEMYAIEFIDYDEQYLIRIDLRSMNTVNLGLIPCPLASTEGKWTGMASDTSSGRMYMVCTDGTESIVGYLGLPDTEFMQLCTVDRLHEVSAIAFDNDSLKLLGIDNQTDSIYYIDQNTGNSHRFFNLDYDAENYQSMSYETVSEDIYIVGYNNDSDNYEMRFVDWGMLISVFDFNMEGESTLLGFPDEHWGLIPENLLQYVIYRDDECIDTVDKDFYEWYDFNLYFPREYKYNITALYDLEPYGMPGQTGESMFSEETWVMYGIWIIYPFIYDFTYWFCDFAIIECENNWLIDTASGNPKPSAIFNSSDTVTDYSCKIKTYGFIPVYVGDVIMEFGIKLDDVTASGTEQLNLYVDFYDSVHLIKGFSNLGDFDWKRVHVNLTEHVLGNSWVFYFEASGENSSNINKWHIDNIYIIRFCEKPENLQAQDYPDSGYIKLTWTPVKSDTNRDHEFLGYNIYRSFNYSPFEEIYELYNDTVFYDEIISNGDYSYCLLSVFHYECWGSSDTVSISFPSSIQELPRESHIEIYPIPAKNKLHINSETEIQTLKLLNISGKILVIMEGLKEGSHQINVSDLENGVYFVSVETVDKDYTYKVLINN